MRHMSFALTTDQFRDRTKTVTRRSGWKNLKPGEIVMGCVKCQGLKKGERVERLGPIRVVEVSRIQLCEISPEDCRREGFPDLTPFEFMEMYCRHNGGNGQQIVTRILFEYVDQPALVQGA